LDVKGGQIAAAVLQVTESGIFTGSWGGRSCNYAIGIYGISKWQPA
jgi:hypothetical protein